MIMPFSKVENDLHLYRDDSTGAIISTDHNSYNQYVSSRKNKENLKNQQIMQGEEIKNIKNEISEIKSLIVELLNEISRK